MAKTATRATEICDLIHSDVHGPLPIQTREGYRYWVSFIDDKSRFWVVMALRNKSDVFAAFQRFQAYAETQTGRKIKAFRNDKGGEYISNAFKAHLQKCGIVVQHTIRNEPHQNGVAERSNRTLAEGIITLLTEAKLPPSFWEYALNTFVHVRNRMPTAALQDGTPYSHWFGGRIADVSHLRVFGCTAYVNVQRDQRRGLQSHTRKCIFVGYPEDAKGWRFYDPESKDIPSEQCCTV